MDPQELVPLEAGYHRPPRPSLASPRNCYLAPRSCYIVPLRLCRLLGMLIILPSLFILIPLYLRYRVFSGQMYPMSMTDMRLIDSKISTTWCQRQVVRSNATFNAFVVPGQPELTQDLVPVSMTRELELGDDMKEYWGFYLLKGSSVTVSTCVRHPGASLIMIKGYKHLQDCAYIGDDSSEELDELFEAYDLGLMTNTTFFEKIQNLTKDDGKANDPGAMRRHKAGVSFHDPNKANVTVSTVDNGGTLDIPETDPDHDPKELREILERLHALREAAKIQHAKNYHPPSNILSLPALHRHRDANVDKDERRFISFQDLDGNYSEIIPPRTKTKPEIVEEPLKNNNTEKMNSINGELTNTKEVIPNDNTTENDKAVTETDIKYNKTSNKEDISDDNTTENDKAVTETDIKNNKTSNKKDISNDNTTENDKAVTETDIKYNKTSNKADISNDNTTENDKAVTETDIKYNKTSNKEDISNNNTTENDKAVTETYIKNTKTINNVTETSTKYKQTTESPLEESEDPNSKEVFEDVLKRLQALGDRGKRVLVKLHQTMGVEYQESPKQSTDKLDIMSVVTGSGEELDRLRKVLVEAIDEEKTRSQRQKRRHETMEQARGKREMMLGQIELSKAFNEDDEARDYAAEEGLEPDGYAEHHVQLNETTPFDMSNSEFWSSFSSSEEALLECEGLILNLPLTPHSSCVKNASQNLSSSAAKANALTYRVPANGYYFFVFSSENEVNVNFIRAKFELQKTRYDVARTKLRECTNSTERCDLPLDIFTSQKVVLEVPLRNNDSLWNEQFVIISECEPRTSIYLFCVIAVPVLIIVFAFQ